MVMGYSSISARLTTRATLPRLRPAPCLSLSAPLEQALQVLQEKMVPVHAPRPLQVRGSSWPSFRQRQHTTQECFLLINLIYTTVRSGLMRLLIL